MKKFASLLLILLLSSGLGAGCAVKVPAVTEAMPISTVQGGGSLASRAASDVGTQTRYFSGSDSLPPLAKHLQVESMAFRSLIADAGDQTADVRKDESLVDQCPSGRANLDFIQSVQVGVRHSNEKDEEAVLVGDYTQTQKGLCGFHLTTTNFDMKEYASDYVFVVRVTGTRPSARVNISGFYTIQDYEGL